MMNVTWRHIDQPVKHLTVGHATSYFDNFCRDWNLLFLIVLVLIHCINCTNTHTQPFNGPFSRTTQASWYQKGKTNLDFTEARDSEWQCHQLGHMQVCTLLQRDNHTSNPTTLFFTGRMPFLPPNQQCQSTNCTNTRSIKQFSTVHYKNPLQTLTLTNVKCLQSSLDCMVLNNICL